MQKNFTTQLAGQIGENLVVAELGRRGIVATTFAGNVPEIDILAYRNGKSLPVQVKSWRSGTLHFDAAKFLAIRFEGNVQIVEGPLVPPDPNLTFIFVRIGEALKSDRFFMVPLHTLQSIMERNHTEYLRKHGGVRPKNPMSTHTAVRLVDIVEYEGCWDLIESRL
tara:strand:+ start:339 stop:836 length:498 start_codon:yes stop_codon:yes gene_type:complete